MNWKNSTLGVAAKAMAAAQRIISGDSRAANARVLKDLKKVSNIPIKPGISLVVLSIFSRLRLFLNSTAFQGIPQ
tara:strand:+ start:232 stop:456 length:225 start_codon:yes stop_codon:yes gene_type:complete